MIDFSEFKQGDKIGTVYEVRPCFNGFIDVGKYEGCFIECLTILPHGVNCRIKDKDGRVIYNYCGSPLLNGIKIDSLYFSLDDACNRYKELLEQKISALSKEIASLKKTVLFGLKDAFK